MAREVMLVCEDQVGAALLERLIRDRRPALEVYATQIKGSNSQIKAQLDKYINASRAGVRHIILTDLDNHACAPSLLAKWAVPAVPGFLCFRVAVHEAEAWLMADKEALSAFLQLPIAQIPHLPDAVPDPKQALLNLVRRSRVKDLRRDILPEAGSFASKGILYNERWCAFIHQEWDPARAAQRSDSLRRAIRGLASL